MRIETKLMLFFIILAAMAIGVVSYIYTENASAAISERTAEQLGSISMMKKSQLDHYVEEKINRLGILAGQLEEEAGEHNASPATDPDAWQWLLEEAHATEGGFDAISIIALNGTVVASTDAARIGSDASGFGYFARAKSAGTAESLFHAPETRVPPAYAVATPLMGIGGNAVAVLEGRLGFYGIGSMMLEPAGMGATGEVFLVNGYGVPVTTLKKSVAEQDAPIHSVAVEECIQGWNGSARFTDYHGDDVIVRYNWLQDHGMCIISKIDASEALGPIRKIETGVVLISLVLFVLAVGISFVALRAVLAPIEELTSVVSAISKGKMRTELSPKLKESQDEIGKLARAFDRTLVSLKLAMKESAPELKLESKALREALDERTRAEGRYKALVKTSPDAVIVTDPKGIVTEVSGRAVSLFGMKNAEELIGMDAYEFLPEKDRKEARRLITKMLEARGEMEGAHLTMERKDKTTFSGEVNIKRLKDAAGRHMGTILTLRDVTKREAEENKLRRALESAGKAEKELKAERDLAEKYLDIAGVMLVALDARGNVVRMNRKGCEMLGYAEAEILGRNWFDTFVPKEARERTKEVFAKLMKGGIDVTEYYESEVLTKNGEEKLIAWRNTVLRDDGRITGTLSSGEDIGWRKASEERLRILSRLYSTSEEIGRIAAVARGKKARPAAVLQKICRTLVEKGGFLMVWVGRVDETTGKVEPVASAGRVKGYLDDIRISTQDAPEGHGPTGTAIRENRTVAIEDWAKDPRMKPWAAAGAKRGYRSSAAFPLRKGDKVVGALNVYSEKPGFFDPENIRLLEDSAMVVSAAIFTKSSAKKRGTGD